MIKYLMTLIFFVCVPQMMHADDLGTSLYNWLVNGIDIPFIRCTRDISLSEGDKAAEIGNEGTTILGANNVIMVPCTFLIGKKKYQSIKNAKRIFPCIKQIPGNIVRLNGRVRIKGLSRERTGITMTYKFMPLDFLLIASVGCGAYWFYKNKYVKN